MHTEYVNFDQVSEDAPLQVVTAHVGYGLRYWYGTKSDLPGWRELPNVVRVTLRFKTDGEMVVILASIPGVDVKAACHNFAKCQMFAMLMFQDVVEFAKDFWLLDENEGGDGFYEASEDYMFSTTLYDALDAFHGIFSTLQVIKESGNLTEDKTAYQLRDELYSEGFNSGFRVPRAEVLIHPIQAGKEETRGNEMGKNTSN